MPSPPDSPSTFPRLVGRAVERVEDAALLAGRGRFADDVGERTGTAHAAVLRSPHAHAEIVSLDATAALSMLEVVTVLTGKDIVAWSRPFIAGVKQPMRHYALAVDRVRYTGEPVAVVVARDRYAAEDALERIEVEYRELDPVVGPVAAVAPGAPLLHRDVGSNVVSDRRLRYGDPDAAFASAAHRVAISVRYPRNACTPIEGFVFVAEHLGDDGYDVRGWRLESVVGEGCQPCGQAGPYCAPARSWRRSEWVNGCCDAGCPSNGSIRDARATRLRRRAGRGSTTESV